jgi:hypothetical protein
MMGSAVSGSTSRTRFSEGDVDYCPSKENCPKDALKNDSQAEVQMCKKNKANRTHRQQPGRPAGECLHHCDLFYRFPRLTGFVPGEKRLEVSTMAPSALSSGGPEGPWGLRYCIAPLQSTAPHCTALHTALQFHLALQVKSGRLHFLLVSPEAVVGGGGAFGTLLPHLLPIVFVCIDEAH